MKTKIWVVIYGATDKVRLNVLGRLEATIQFAFKLKILPIYDNNFMVDDKAYKVIAVFNFNVNLVTIYIVPIVENTDLHLEIDLGGN